MRIKTVQRGLRQLAGWLTGFWLSGTVAGAQADNIECLQIDQFYGCCGCQFQPLEVPDTSHCEFSVIQARCVGYVRTDSSRVGMFFTFGGNSDSVTNQHNETCVKDSFSHCWNMTGLFHWYLDDAIAPTFGCILANTAADFLSFGFFLDLDRLLPYSQRVRGKLTSNPGNYPMLLGQGQEGLPVAVFNLTWDNPPAEQGYYLYHRFTDQGEGSWSNSSLWVNSTGSSSLFQAGSLTRGQGIEIRVVSDGCQALGRVARNEHLGDVTLDQNLQALTFTWNRVDWPDILGSVNVTTATRQPLATDCQTVNNDQYYCLTNLSSTLPIDWLLIRAGQLVDAETLNYTRLAPLWQIPAAGWSWFSGSRSLSIRWQQAPVAAESYQVDRLCQNTTDTAWTNNSHYIEQASGIEEASGDCQQNCSFRILPVYQGSAYDDLGIELTSVPQVVQCLTTGIPETSDSLVTTRFQETSDSLVMTQYQETSDSLVMTQYQETSDSLLTTQFQKTTSTLATTAPPMLLPSSAPLPSSNAIGSAGNQQSGWEWPTLPAVGGISGKLATAIVVIVVVVVCGCAAQVTVCAVGCAAMR